ncbi:beta-galactosidase [Marinivivus vitaminiproducens]|uniref:beta-galactosidase n=1 Tax=Marinivivus vitaminiproducens TaxID=3035935 RepID=UPI00279993CB|nr:beta-galactosidase [Geminicoccaceae bacterium SCSIO 64248]
MPTDTIPQIPFGAVYFRKSNPPKADWDRDYGIAAEDGLNVFRHWFMWSAIERRPGYYEWDDYDRQLDLAAGNGIKTIVAEMTHTVPDWAYRAFAHARQIRADGRPLTSNMGASAAIGGFASNGGGAGALSMNCPEVKEAAGNFLKALATRYKGHPGLLGYDVWNEVNYAADVDYSEYMKADFRLWLREKYGDLETLSQAWHRYSYAEWDDIEPPREIAAYPENLDWLDFKRANYYGQMQWRIDTIRSIDRDCLIAAHGVGGAIPNMAANGCDDWLAASKVEVYGLTWVPSRRGFKPWQNFFGPDLTRAAARGKTWWHAERPGGPLWMQPQVLGHDKDDGRVMDPEDIRLLTMTSFAAGAQGVMNLRYRPLLDGPLFGAFGSYGMDGARTARSDMASEMAKWANAAEQAELFEARPVMGDIGLLVIPEAQAWDYLLNANHCPNTYREAMWGAYRGFFDNGVQADWVHIDDIEGRDLLYAPYPIMLTGEHASRLARWVERGGVLISEATPGYFGDRGTVGVVQPNSGLDAVFGTREHEVEFMPDIGDRIAFTLDDRPIQGGGFLQSYAPTTGTERGRFTDGRIAVVENTHGSGRTLLVGTNPGIAYFRNSGRDNRGYFADVLAWSGKAQRVQLSENAMQARLHEGGSKRVLWLLNPTRNALSTGIRIDGESAAFGRVYWAAPEAAIDTGNITVPARDAVIVQLST